VPLQTKAGGAAGYRFDFTDYGKNFRLRPPGPYIDVPAS
jgi:hypothetical protein